MKVGSPPYYQRKEPLKFFLFLTDSGNKDDPEVSDDLVCDDSSSFFKFHSSPLELSWGCSGICFLLVILCVSAGVLWYRIFLLHSHLELRLSPETTGELNSPVTSLYSPQVRRIRDNPLHQYSFDFVHSQMQELVDNLHLLLTSRTTNEQRERPTVTWNIFALCISCFSVVVAAFVKSSTLIPFFHRHGALSQWIPSNVTSLFRSNSLSDILFFELSSPKENCKIFSNC